MRPFDHDYKNSFSAYDIAAILAGKAVRKWDGSSKYGVITIKEYRGLACGAVTVDNRFGNDNISDCKTISYGCSDSRNKVITDTLASLDAIYNASDIPQQLWTTAAIPNRTTTMHAIPNYTPIMSCQAETRIDIFYPQPTATN